MIQIVTLIYYNLELFATINMTIKKWSEHMKKIIMVIVVVLLIINNPVYGMDVPINISDTNPTVGQTITVSGITNIDMLISIKAIDGGGNIIYFNVVKSDTEGNYNDTLVVPDKPGQSVTIIAGSGNDIQTAQFNIQKKSSGSNNSKEPSSEILKPIVPQPKIDIKTGEVIVSLEAINFENVFQQMPENEDGRKTMEIQVPLVQDAKHYNVEMPSEVLADSTDKEIKINTDIGSIVLPGNMLSEEGEMSGNISLNFGKANKEQLDEETRNKIGDRPVIEISLEKDGNKISWSNDKTPVTITLPYIPTEEELQNPEKITVWYIDGEGNIIAVPNGRYDEETGMVIFDVTHFSTYSVVYVDKTFKDLDNHLWAKNQIAVLASKGIINGTSQNTYAPSMNITRADFITLLIKTLDLKANFTDNFDDVYESDYYYKPIGIAKALEITNGSGNNAFKPNKKITRQEMMVLAEKALTRKGMLEKADIESLDGYQDIDQIAAYALDSIAKLVQDGLIRGHNYRINPKDYTTRAEAAVFLYKVYNKDRIS